jgi:predicted N-formylglutamate amidohydrolase
MTNVALLGPDDPAPFELCQPQGRARLVLACDHASRAVPRGLNNLGLADDIIAQHIGWDIGAAEVARHLAKFLDAPAILCGFSRLVIDCNRAPDNPSSIPLASDGIAIPGNAGLTDAERLARREAIFAPYHAAIEAKVAALSEGESVPAVIAIHSFTPTMNRFKRPWHVGVLWDRDGRIAQPLLTALECEAGVVVGDNQPYSAREPEGYTPEHHAAARGLPHVAIELRQDLLMQEIGCVEWAQRLARCLEPILEKPALYAAIAPLSPSS